MTFSVEGKIHFNGTCFHIVSSVYQKEFCINKKEKTFNLMMS